MLPAALAVMGMCTLSAGARSQGLPPPPDAERATSPRSPADLRLRGAPEETIFLCKEVTPSACRGVVAIPMRSGSEPRIEGSRWRTEPDRKTARVVEHGPSAVKLRRIRPGRAPMQNGFEPEPLVELELRREILVFLAEVTGERSLRRAGTQLPRISTIRAIADMNALERARRRATYIQTEDFKGNDKSITTPTAMLAGGILLASGATIDRLILDEPGEGARAKIKPQLWPPGIRIKGRFDWP